MGIRYFMENNNWNGWIETIISRDECYVFSVPGIIILTGILFCLLYFCSKTSFSVTFIVYIRKLCIDRTERKPRAMLLRHVGIRFVRTKVYIVGK